jgi:hypothetical protein
MHHMLNNRTTGPGADAVVNLMGRAACSGGVWSWLVTMPSVSVLALRKCSGSAVAIALQPPVRAVRDDGRSSGDTKLKRLKQSAVKNLPSR